VPGIAMEHVVARAAAQRVVAVTTIQGVVAVLTIQYVVAAQAVDRIVARVRVNDVNVRRTVDGLAVNGALNVGHANPRGAGMAPITTIFLGSPPPSACPKWVKGLDSCRFFLEPSRPGTFEEKMLEAGNAAELIGAIYEAGAFPERWPDALEQLASAF